MPAFSDHDSRDRRHYFHFRGTTQTSGMLPKALTLPPLTPRRRSSRALAAIGLSFLILTALLHLPLDTLVRKEALEAASKHAVGIGSGPDSEAAQHRKTLVVAAVKTDDTAWLDGYFQDWERRIYVVDDEQARWRVPMNKGKEAMVYLTYIIDNYDSLPPYMVFLHSARYQWHNDDPLYDSVPPLKRLSLAHLASEGYVSLRCTWTLGCPTEMRPLFDEQQRINNPLAPDPLGYAIKEPFRTGEVYAEAFRVLFPNTTVPDSVGTKCCAQFGVTRETVRRRGRDEYVRVRKWLIETDFDDYTSGRILEYSWHILFGKEPVFCPDVKECYCKLYGLCDLECKDNGTCKGRYTFPKYSELPEGWPYRDWEGKKTGATPEY